MRRCLRHRHLEQELRDLGGDDGRQRDDHGAARPAASPFRGLFLEWRVVPDQKIKKGGLSHSRGGWEKSLTFTLLDAKLIEDLPEDL